MTDEGAAAELRKEARQWMTVGQVADHYGISESTVYRMMRDEWAGCVQRFGRGYFGSTEY